MSISSGVTLQRTHHFEKATKFDRVLLLVVKLPVDARHDDEFSKVMLNDPLKSVRPQISLKSDSLPELLDK